MKWITAFLSLGLVLCLTAFEGSAPLEMLEDVTAGAAPVPSSTTTSNMVVYTNATTGNDAYPCSQTRPCKGIQSALSRIPHHIANSVNVNVGPGTYAEDVNIVFDIFGSGSLLVSGTDWSSFVPDAGQGPGSGVLSIADAGWFDYYLSPYPNDAGTTGTWTAHSLQGKFVVTEPDGGPPQYIPIADNTDTVLKLPSYADSTLIGMAVHLATPAASITGNPATTAPLMTIQSSGMGGAIVTSGPVIQNLNINDAAGKSAYAAVLVEQSNPTLQRLFINDSTVRAMKIEMSSDLEINNVALRSAGNVLGPTRASVSLSKVAVIGGVTGGIWMGSASSIYARGLIVTSGGLSSSYGIGSNTTNPTGMVLWDTLVTGHSLGAIVLTTPSSNIYMFGHCLITGEAIGAQILGNNNFIDINSTSDINNCSVTELRYGTTDSTLANLRAQNPKVLKDTTYNMMFVGH